MSATCLAVVLSLCVPSTWPAPPSRDIDPKDRIYMLGPNGERLAPPVLGAEEDFDGLGAHLSIETVTDVPVAILTGDSACAGDRCVLYWRECTSRTDCEYTLSYGGRHGGYRFSLKADTVAAYRQAEKDIKILVTKDDEAGIPLAALKRYRRVKLPEWLQPVPP